jgi:translation initiation factor eIF-2B subunit delta
MSVMQAAFESYFSHYLAITDKSGKFAGAAISKQAKPVKTVQKKDVPQAASTVVSEKKATERPPERERK